MKRSQSIVLISVLALVLRCGGDAGPDPASSSPPAAPAQEAGTPDTGKALVTNRLDIDFSKHLVTFIELGADRCIPCKAMQPIMKEIAETYADKIQVVFYDVWKDPEPGRKYKIQLIPTQVFIDQKGNEISRHVGFFAKEEILSLLKEKGLL